MKNLTRLWPGSSSTLAGNKRNQKHPTLKKLRYDSTTEAAHKAVRELSEIRGGRNGTREAGSPDSL